MKLTKEELKEFLKERPSISVRSIEIEAKLPSTKIKEVLNGNQKFKSEQEQRLLIVLQKYGWKE